MSSDYLNLVCHTIFWLPIIISIKIIFNIISREKSNGKLSQQECIFSPHDQFSYQIITMYLIQLVP